ncbi:hypothetical protein [Lysobacter sp. CFH 32150]|uniref:hypothetical protein n=1 Tax=Lysobacter sp. CFH 32150 TaxID=2927128 RepID=UPI001FA760E2|nr:hypothetical protein [Lysobacter sp. CFH 32150]MCI4567338.1 hypothetical protein [Lysobacter sp. CFH 32150]
MRTIAAAGQDSRHRGTAGWRASAFVRDLLQRHHWMRLGATWPEQVFAAPNTLMTVNAPHQHWHLAYAPRVMLQLASSTRAMPMVPQTTAPDSVRQHTVLHDGPRFVSTLVERVLQHSQRIDTLQTIEHAAPATLRHEASASAVTESRIAPAPDREGRVQRVFRTNAGSVSKATAERSAASPQSTAPTARQALQATERAPSRDAPPINIEHLADRVVHAIDRRLVAQRERFGRA